MAVPFFYEANMDEYKCDCGREKVFIENISEAVICECGQEMCRIITLRIFPPIPIQEIKPVKKKVESNIVKL